MAILTANASGILAPEEVGPLIIQPLRLRSVALRVSTVIETTRPSLRYACSSHGPPRQRGGEDLLSETVPYDFANSIYFD
jgi:hypothetical protein